MTTLKWISFLVLAMSWGFTSGLAHAEESVPQKIKNAAHETKDDIKGEWKKTKPKIKSAFKDIKKSAKKVGHTLATDTKKTVKDLKPGH